MAPVDRLVPRFAAEPPQEGLPYGRWAHRLSEEFYAACLRVDTEGEELGEPGDIAWFPDRTFAGRTYVPGTADTAEGFQLYGYVSFVPAAADGGEAGDLRASADFTAETAARNPDWELDLCEEVIGSWRGEGDVATMTLVWGTPVSAAGAVATAELADLSVDQCELVENRFTLIAPDDYRGDFLEIKLFDRAGGRELARESLYVADDEEDEEQAADAG